MDLSIKTSAALGFLAVAVFVAVLPSFAAANNSHSYPVYGTKRYQRRSAPDSSGVPVAVARYDNDDADADGELDTYVPYDRESEYYGQPTYAGEYDPKPFYYAQGPRYSLYDDEGNARSGLLPGRPATNPLDDLHEQMQQENAARRERQMRQRMAAVAAGAGRGDGLAVYDDDASADVESGDPQTSRAFFRNLMAYNRAMNQQRAAAAAAEQFETQAESYNPALMATYDEEYAPVQSQQFEQQLADNFYDRTNAESANAMNNRRQQQQQQQQVVPVAPVKIVDQDVQALQSLEKSSTPKPKLAGTRNKGRQNNKAKNGEKNGKKGNKNKNQKQQKEANKDVRKQQQQQRQLAANGKTQQQQNPQKQTNKQRKKEQRRLQREQERSRVQKQQQVQEAAAAALAAEQLASDEQRMRYEQLAKHQAEERRQQQELEREQLMREQHWMEQQQQQQQQQQPPTRSQQRQQQKQQQQQQASGSMLRTGEPTSSDGTYYTDPEYDDTWTSWDRKRSVNAAVPPLLVPYETVDYEAAIEDMDIDQLLQEAIGAVYASESLVIRPKALNHEQPQQDDVSTLAPASMTAPTQSPPVVLLGDQLPQQASSAIAQGGAKSRSGQKEVLQPRPATPVRRPFAAPIMQLLAAQRMASTPAQVDEENAPLQAYESKRGNDGEVYNTIRKLMHIKPNLEEKTNKVKREYVSNEESLVHELRNLKQAQSSA